VTSKGRPPTHGIVQWMLGRAITEAYTAATCEPKHRAKYVAEAIRFLQQVQQALDEGLDTNPTTTP
jgi:hypothetical protein